MKYLFGTYEKGDHGVLPEQDGQGYQKACLPDSMLVDLGEKEKALEKARRGARLPIWLKIVKYICFLGGIICLGRFIQVDLPFAQKYHNAPAIFWFIVIGLPLSALLYLLEKNREKHINENEMVQRAVQSLQAAKRNALTYLGIPANAVKMDIMIFDYSLEDGTLELEDLAAIDQMYLYPQASDTLCVTDGEELFALPREQFTALRRLGCSARFFHLSDENLDRSKYEEAGAEVDKYGTIKLDFCCALEWTDRGETWQMLFPACELPKMKALTGLQEPVQEEQLRTADSFN